MSTQIGTEEQTTTLPKFTIETALRAVLYRSNQQREFWEGLREEGKNGIANDTIYAALTRFFGPKGVTDSSAGIIHIRGGATPKVWFGSYNTKSEPALKGQAVIDHVRKLLDLPLTSFEAGLQGGPDLDRVPGDPHERGWNSLSDQELEQWEERLTKNLSKGGRKSTKDDSDGKRLELVRAEINRRSETETESSQETEAALSQSLAPVPLFDYSALDRDLATELEDHAREIKYRLKRTVTDTIEVGRRLTEVKNRLAGSFTAWLKFEFDLSERTGRYFMDVYEVFGQEPALPEIPPKVLYLAASSSTPAEARREIVERARSGEIKYEEAREIVERHREVEEASRPKQMALVDAAPHKSGENITEPITDQSATVADPQPGECRICGCTQENACQLGDGETCGWAAGERKTLCTSCRDIMKSRGWSEETTRARIRQDEIDLAGEPSNVATRTEAKAETVPESPQEEPETTAQSKAAVAADEAVKRYEERQAAKSEEKSKSLAELLKGRMLVITYTYLPELPDKVSVVVRVGDDASKIAIESLELSRARHPEQVSEMIAAQIERADREAKAAKANAKKQTEGAQVEAKKQASSRRSKSRAKTAKPSSKKAPAKKAAAKKPAKKSTTGGKS